ncbi:MAG: dockerin type I repeat-containing protein [Candidatus Zixiibacteriota bacterium]|nr:MAG: dockerin type I repeat-containing protein [candidate division Zixibacteria bacterium]
MNKIKLSVTLIVAIAFTAVLGVHAQSNKELQPKKVEQKAASVQLKDKAEPKQVVPGASEIQGRQTSFPQTAPFTPSRQGYKLVTDVLDGLGGESESDNYRIPVNSGGQPSAAGLSESANWGMGAGFVHASHVKPGDATADGLVNVADIVYLVNYLYRGGAEPCPPEAGDATRDSVVNVADIVYLVNYLYRGGDPPAR